MKKLFMLLFIISSLFAEKLVIKNKIFVDNYQDLQYAINNMPENSIIHADITDFNKNIDIINKNNLYIYFSNGISYNNLNIKHSTNIVIYGNQKPFKGSEININDSRNIFLSDFYILSSNFELNINNQSKVQMYNINYANSKNKTEYDDKFKNYNFNNYYININDSIFFITLSIDIIQ
jgi:hypothetical protein